MWTTYNLTNIRLIIDRILRNPLMKGITLEAAVQYAVDFIGIMGLPAIYIDKQEKLKIKDFRTLLPCDCIAVNQVRECKTKICLRSMTGNFIDDRKQQDVRTFKIQGRVLFTSFKEGEIEISYKAIPIDEEGYPMIPDNPVFLKALELYIKKEWFTILFDMGRIEYNVLQNAQQDYAFKAGQCNNEFIIPSASEMQSITGIMNQLLPRWNEFAKGFEHLGDKEYWRVQQ